MTFGAPVFCNGFVVPIGDVFIRFARAAEYRRPGEVTRRKRSRSRSRPAFSASKFSQRHETYRRQCMSTQTILIIAVIILFLIVTGYIVV